MSHLDVAPPHRVVASAIAPTLAVVGAAATCAFVLAADPTTPGGVSPPCPTKALFGIVCPGCGAARMLYSLLHGDVGAALAYNAVGVVSLALILWTFVAWTASRLGGHRMPRWEAWRWSPIVIGIVVAAWTVARNLPFAPFTALAV